MKSLGTFEKEYRMPLKIGELAKLSGCQVVTIRYYEKEGLLPPPERTNSNYRLYSEGDVERLHFIRRCRLHGMNLAEIRKLLAFKDNPTVSCAWVNDLVDKHIADVESQIASLQHLKEQLGSPAPCLRRRPRAGLRHHRQPGPRFPLHLLRRGTLPAQRVSRLGRSCARRSGEIEPPSTFLLHPGAPRRAACASRPLDVPLPGLRKNVRSVMRGRRARRVPHRQRDQADSGDAA